MTLRAIKFVSIPVSDQDRSLDFYTQKLGLKLVTDQPFDDKQRWIELRIPRAQTRLVLFTMPGHEDRIGTMTNLAFVSDDVRATYEQLVAKGVQFDGEPEEADWGTSAVFRDPDGNRLLVSSK